jgi:hypothetical protein
MTAAIKMRNSEHIIRMDQTYMAEKIFDCKPSGRRKGGRFRLRWLEDVENYL